MKPVPDHPAAADSESILGSLPQLSTEALPGNEAVAAKPNNTKPSGTGTTEPVADSAVVALLQPKQKHFLEMNLWDQNLITKD
jgi:hypothetical protein